MINLTESQRLAVERNKGDVYVSAAAGSGKTSVLVERIVGILTDKEEKVEADRLLVVTYTRAAAAEMSRRIKRRLHEQLSLNRNDSWLHKQLNLIKQTNISTIHSFCMSLLKEFWNELNIPSDFTLMDDLFLRELKISALRAAAERVYSEDIDFGGFSDLFGRARTDTDALRTIETFSNFMNDIASPDEWTNRFLKDLLEEQNISSSEHGKLMLSYAKESLEAAKIMMERALFLARQDEKLFLAYSEAFSYDSQFIDKVLKQIDLNSWDNCIKLLDSYVPIRLGNSRGTDIVLRESSKALRDTVKELLQDDIKRKYFPIKEREFKKDEETVTFAFVRLIKAVKIYKEELDRLKLQYKAYEFSDLERYTIELLESNDRIREEITSRYRHILVDEFQDTNEVQEKLFNLLKGKQTAVFAVGDVKQSIYRFRRADPDIFIASRKKAFSSNLNKYPAHILLAENFRSEKNVIVSINNIFTRIMTEAVGDVSYTSGEELTTSKENVLDEPGIEVKIILNDKENSEAKEAAILINKMIEDKYQIVERKDGTYSKRDCEPKDFCVLMRTKARIAEFEEAFRNIGLPVRGDRTGNLLDASEIKVVVALLSVIDNPRRDIDMASVMLSPLFSFTPDFLLELKKDNRHLDIYTLLQKRLDDPKVENFLLKLEQYRYLASSEPIDELLIRVIDETDAELLLSSGDDYLNRRENIRDLINIASNEAEKGNMSLGRFLKILLKSETSDIRQGNYVKSEDAVDIITIHRAKGLEWPIVILADTNKKFNYTDIRSYPVVFDRNLGIGVKYKTEIEGDNSPFAMKSTLRFRAIVAKQDRKIVSEEMRVLYVALTRAKQKVIVTVTTNKIESIVPNIVKDVIPIPYLVADDDSYIKWILYGINESKKKIVDELTTNGFFSDGSISVEIAEITEETDVLEDEEEKTVSDTSSKILEEQVKYIYPLSKLNEIPAVVSVTGLLGHDYFGTPTPSFMDESYLSPSARGSLIHSFMQYANLENATNNISKELNRLVSEGYIREEYINTIDIYSIENFLMGDLGQRMVKGKTEREYSFISSIDASLVVENLPQELQKEQIIIEGVVDCLIFEEDGIILLDYKTDKVDNGNILKERYQKQLELYKMAIEKRFSMKTLKMYIYSFYLNEVVEV